MDSFYNLEKRKLEEKYHQTKINWETNFPNGFRLEDGTIWPLEELIRKMVYEALHDDLKNLRAEFERIEGRTHYFIGINPPKSINMEDLYQQMLQMINKFKMFHPDNYLMCIEQNTSNGIRPHIHLMLETKVRPARIIEQLAKHFKIDKPSIDLKKHSHSIMWDEHINYIKGKKKDEKMADVQQDVQDRTALGIPQYLGELI